MESQVRWQEPTGLHIFINMAFIVMLVFLTFFSYDLYHRNELHESERKQEHELEVRVLELSEEVLDLRREVAILSKSRPPTQFDKQDPTPEQINDALDAIRMPPDERATLMTGGDGHTLKTLRADSP